MDRLTTALSEKTELVRELERARAELAARHQELMDARDRAERAKATLSTFLHALGHDLRAPLVALDASVQLLELELLDGTALPQASSAQALRQTTEEMRRTCGHGLALIHDLFELIRSDAGAWRVEPSAIRLGELVANACAVVAPAIGAKGLLLETRWCLDGTPADGDAVAARVVVTDPTRVAQALVNLLGNAVKFTPSGNLTLTIGLDAREERTELSLVVEDEGPGIEPAALQRIFEPFAQGEAGVRSRGGVGLGLAIVQRCARLLGGEVAVSNRRDRGARFELRVPVDGPETTATAEARACPSASRPSAPTAQASSLRHRVLVVDDAPDAARLLVHHLRALGATATHAPSLRDARRHLEHNEFDLVITDLDLEDGSGMELLEDTHTCADGWRRDPDGGAPRTAHGSHAVVLSSATPAENLPAAYRGRFLAKPVVRDAVRRLLEAMPARADASDGQGRT